MGRIEILKGPSSSMYGAGLGGTIQLIPNKGEFNKVAIKGGYTLGSFGLQKYLLQANLGNQTNSANIIYSNTHSDGYRENNELDRKIMTIATNHFLNDKNQLTFIGNYIDLKAFIPSSLNENDYINNPTKAAFIWEKARGYEDYKKGLFGLSWQHDYNAKTKQITSVFTSFLDSYEPRPFNILKEKTNAIGLRTRILSDTKLFDKFLQWTIGGEIFSDKNAYQTYKNLYKDFPSEEGSVQGYILSDFKENRTYFNLFLDSKYEISTKTIFSFGLNFNYTVYKLNDNLTSNNTDFSGDYNFGSILSPKLGLTHQVSSNIMVYGTISHGFSPPTLEETLLPDGLINTSIKPESGWNYEIGSRGKIFYNKLFFDLALYRMNVENLLVARRTASDEFIGINAGKTQYNGMELTLNYDIIKSKKIKIVHSNSIVYNDFKFKEFIEKNNDYSGNQLTGVPKFTFFSQLNFESNIGFYAFISYNYVGEMPMRDDNSIYSDKYQLINTKIGYKSSENKKFQFDLFVGVNNVFDEKYASMLLINAGSFGNKAPRYYYPGEPINYYSGIILKYTF
ncbi:MAG: TonB-dependent receptor [Flavobacteriaceae bacterium]|nr:TonB-dependent receptor [Flavobacteriaceae bacterium]